MKISIALVSCVALPLTTLHSAAAPQFCDTEVAAQTPVVQSQFGSNVDVSFDEDTFVVGSPLGSLNGCSSGTVNIYDLVGNSWVQSLELGSPGSQCDGQFGYDVSISTNTLVVGAPFEDVGGLADAGRVYVFERSGGVWTLAQTLTEVTPFAGSRFGHSVSTQGGRIAVGAIRSAFFGPSAGAAYVFRDFNGTYVFEDRLAPSPAQAGAFFGTSVSIFGPSCIVGAVYDEEVSTQGGAAYVFERQPNTTWDPVAKLTPPIPANDTFFGIAVTVRGAIAIVGAEGLSNGAANSGSAFAYRRSSSNGWVFENEFQSPSPSSTGSFGRAVSVTNGSAAITDFSTNGGLVALFDRAPGGVWTSAGTIELNDPANPGAFGTECSIKSNTLVVGAPLRSTSVPFSGAAFVYDLNFEDCNSNGLNDFCELLTNPGLIDCNGDGEIDSCQLAADPALDCDGNGILDTCDLALFPTRDCDGNGVLDSCELFANPGLDCNFNGILDACDIAAGNETDLNGNLIPDQCEAIGTNPGCQTLANSTGGPSTLAAIGSGTIAGNDLMLLGGSMPANVFGFPLVSRTAGANVPQGSVGFLCLGGVIGRDLDNIFNTGSNGSASIPIDVLQIPQGNVLQNAVVGETWHWQLWHRDIFAGQNSSSFTDSLVITFN